MSFHPVGPLDDLWPGEMRRVLVESTPVLLVNVDGEVSAFEDRCSHQAVPLSEGRLEACVLTCRAHEWQFDATTGEGLNPRNVRLRRFPVRIVAGGILVEVSR